MNSVIAANSIRFIVLVLAQALILNHINFMGYINPYIYILFIILYPVKNDRLLFIFLGFLLGLSVDMFSDSGGVHAAACVLLAFIRPAVLKSVFGALYEHQTIKFDQITFSQKLVYISLLTTIHHMVMFLLEIFNISQIIFILQKTLFSSIFTIILSILITIIFSRKST